MKIALVNGHQRSVRREFYALSNMLDHSQTQGDFPKRLADFLAITAVSEKDQQLIEQLRVRAMGRGISTDKDQLKINLNRQIEYMEAKVNELKALPGALGQGQMTLPEAHQFYDYNNTWLNETEQNYLSLQGLRQKDRGQSKQERRLEEAFANVSRTFKAGLNNLQKAIERKVASYQEVQLEYKIA